MMMGVESGTVDLTDVQVLKGGAIRIRRNMNTMLAQVTEYQAVIAAVEGLTWEKAPQAEFVQSIQANIEALTKGIEFCSAAVTYFENAVDAYVEADKQASNVIGG